MISFVLSELFLGYCTDPSRQIGGTCGQSDPSGPVSLQSMGVPSPGGSPKSSDISRPWRLRQLAAHGTTN